MGFGTDKAEGLWVLKTFQLTFISGNTFFRGTKTNDHYRYDFDFEGGERVKSMKFGGDSRVQVIKMDTNWATGLHVGPGNALQNQSIGNGILLGFVGRASDGIDAVGAIFANF
jgi:Jacalin-like lectin domain